MKPEDRKRLKQHIEMIVEHKTPIEELEDMNRKLRLELHTFASKKHKNNASFGGYGMFTQGMSTI